MSRHSIFIGKLSGRMRTSELEDEFTRFGRIRDVDFRKDRGFAFIEFSNSDAAKEAIRKMDQRKINGHRIVVEYKGESRGRRDRGSRDFKTRGPQRQDICFNCGAKGHWANECKQGDWKNKCYRCGKSGHLKKSCSLSRTPDRKRKYSSSRSSSGSSSSSRSRSRSRSRSVSESRNKKKSKRSKSKSRSISSSKSRSSSSSKSSKSKSKSRSKSQKKNKSKSKSRSRSSSKSKSRSRSNSKN